jgi:hypothetical protein
MIKRLAFWCISLIIFWNINADTQINNKDNDYDIHKIFIYLICFVCLIIAFKNI